MWLTSQYIYNAIKKTYFFVHLKENVEHIKTLLRETFYL